jgi:uncharacterized membrane protein YedE/YeeE
MREVEMENIDMSNQKKGSQIFLDSLKHTFVTVVWKRPWPIWVGALAFGFVNILMFIYSRAIGVFPQMSMWGAKFYNFVGVEVEAPFIPYQLGPLHLDLHSMINFGIILGVLMAAFLAREFKIRTEDWRGCLTGFIGGILMGYGTVITPPCNVGGFFSATMALSLSGPLMAIGLLFGAYLGGLYLQSHAKKACMQVDFASAPKGISTNAAKPSKQPYLSVVIIFMIVIAVSIYVSKGMPKHAVLLVFGAVFGIIVQRSRLCFAAAFREILLTRNGSMMKAILLSIGLSSLAFTILKFSGYKPEHFVLPTGIHTVIGGFIFGIGMVIAGGCGIGILWRSAEGYIRSWFAVIGGMLSAGSWMLIYGKHVGEGWLYGKPVFLPNIFGWIGGLAVVFLFLGAFYLLIVRLEVNKNE